MDAGKHISVLQQDVVELLAPAIIRTASRMVDCTLGLGGHSGAILQHSGKDAQLIGMDADEDNVILSRQNLASFGGRVRFFHANFAQLREVLRQADWDRIDVLLADLGFASNQMDNPDRGMSFQADGPLDMRLDQSDPQTAADLVNRMEEGALADLIYQNSDERFSRRIARAIVERRKEQPFSHTVELAEVIEKAYPAPARRNRQGVHPATRTFQALRIAVNNELRNLQLLLDMLPSVMRRGGRVAIISFHSLEDRAVKQAFNRYVEAGWANKLTKKPIIAGETEVAENPRSRSAKLRGLEWIGAE